MLRTMQRQLYQQTAVFRFLVWKLAYFAYKYIDDRQLFIWVQKIFEKVYCRRTKSYNKSSFWSCIRIRQMSQKSFNSHFFKKHPPYTSERKIKCSAEHKSFIQLLLVHISCILIKKDRSFILLLIHCKQYRIQLKKQTNKIRQKSIKIRRE